MQSGQVPARCSPEPGYRRSLSPVYSRATPSPSVPPPPEEQPGVVHLSVLSGWDSREYRLPSLPSARVTFGRVKELLSVASGMPCGAMMLSTADGTLLHSSLTLAAAGLLKGPHVLSLDAPYPRALPDAGREGPQTPFRGGSPAVSPPPPLFASPARSGGRSCSRTSYIEGLQRTQVDAARRLEEADQMLLDEYHHHKKAAARLEPQVAEIFARRASPPVRSPGRQWTPFGVT
eukprot:Hpha_TRINITY_DN9670_c0_g1::TRINITY_DN9670_c0_g1_i2::g.184404::m.184404